MTDIDALHAAILAQPGEDTPRLMYADALDERGGPGDASRAAFIRAQCEIARRGECRSCERHTVAGRAFNMLAGPTLCRPCEALWQRAWKLFRDHGRAWFGFPDGGHLANVTDARWVGVDQTWFVRRGFIAEVSAPLATLMGGEPIRLAVPCPACDGTGTTPAVIPALVQRHPIERVRTDRVPWTHRGVVWSWYAAERDAAGGHHPQSAIPRAVLSRLTRAIEKHYDAAYYRTREDADAALSDALLEWAGAAPVGVAPPPAVV